MTVSNILLRSSLASPQQIYSFQRTNCSPQLLQKTKKPISQTKTVSKKRPTPLSAAHTTKSTKNSASSMTNLTPSSYSKSSANTLTSQQKPGALLTFSALNL